MPETVEHGKWTWHAVMHDLEVQGDLPGVVIDPFSVDQNFCAGHIDDGTKITITWLLDVFLLVSMEKDVPELAKALAKVLGYEPFCKYVEPNGLITYEWDKADPESRYKELQEANDKKKLQHI